MPNILSNFVLDIDLFCTDIIIGQALHNVQSAIALYILYIESKSYPNRDQNSDQHNLYILSIMLFFWSF